MPLILASTSETRIRLLTAAGVPFSAVASRVDEETILSSLKAEGAKPRDIADTLAEMKARKVSEKQFTDHVLGCDQVLEFKDEAWSKPTSPDHALEQLRRLRGQRHSLLSAAVIYHEAKPIWRIVGQARLTMRDLSDSYLQDYVTRNWDSIRHSVGGYKIEEEGARLFSAIEGDSFTVLGLPLLPLLGYLGTRGIIPT